MTSARSGLTRRDVLGGLAAAGAGALLAPAAATAAVMPARRLSRLAVGAVDGLSPVLAPGRAFVLAGVQWSSPSVARIELRSRFRGGEWGPWGLASVRGHEPDHGTDARMPSGEPLWLGPADEVQLRSSQPVADVVVAFVAAAPQSRLAPASSARAAASLPLAQPVLAAGGGQPPIVARSAWAGHDAPPAAGPFYGSVALAFVHHTDNPNGYAAADVPAMLLAIYDYHRYANGWNDIGYNFVIDAFGRIWEARAGGIDEPVIGAQAGGYNAVSTGVAILGTFMSAVPTAAAMSALQRLLAWKLALHGVPALGTVTVEVDPSAAFYTPFAPGQVVELPRIAGHRDGDLTDCPGDDLYAQLPALRTQVAAATGTTLQLTLQSPTRTASPAAPVMLTGTLSELAGGPVAAAPIEIQTITGLGRSTTITRTATDAGGHWTAPVTLTRSSVIRALHSAAPAAVSTVIAIGLMPQIALSVVSASPPLIAGTITPSKPNVTIDIYRLAGSVRRLVLSRRVPVSAGRFASRLTLGPRAHGRYMIVARSAADEVTLAGRSAPVSLKIRSG